MLSSSRYPDSSQRHEPSNMQSDAVGFTVRLPKRVAAEHKIPREVVAKPGDDAACCRAGHYCECLTASNSSDGVRLQTADLSCVVFMMY